MKKTILNCICLLTAIAIMQGVAQAELYEPSFELEKVIGNVYVGKQGAPLEPILGTDPGTYLTMNLYIIVSDDRSEVLLIDGPGLPELLPLFLEAFESEFPDAEIRGVLLTHDHIDHSWSTPYFALNGIPVYASSSEINAPPGMYNMPLADFVTPIEPGFSVPLGDGVVMAVDLTGHTPGQLGYAYYPKGCEGKANWFFAGDAVLAPIDHGGNTDPFDITYFVRLDMLVNDSFSYNIWEDNLVTLRQMLTKHAKIFPGHGAVREGYLWQDPNGYIDHTIEVLQQFGP